MRRSRLNEKYGRVSFDTTPIGQKPPKDQPFLSERNLALFGLVFSFVVISAKIFYGHYETIEKIVLERKLVSYEVISENGQIMFTNTWKTAVKHSNAWLPVLCGFLATYFTWMCVYMDSNEPGVNPPSPLSPQRYRVRSGHTFHLNYVFAVLVGILVTLYMYFKEVSIQY